MLLMEHEANNLGEQSEIETKKQEKQRIIKEWEKFFVTVADAQLESQEAGAVHFNMSADVLAVLKPVNIESDLSTKAAIEACEPETANGLVLVELRSIADGSRIPQAVLLLTANPEMEGRWWHLTMGLNNDYLEEGLKVCWRAVQDARLNPHLAGNLSDAPIGERAVTI